MKKAAPKPYLIKKIAGVNPTSRADYNKAHVIISEKRDKKAAKYLVKDLPYPYTSKAQFERSMDTPLGTEWNTRVGFQRGTLPKVVKKVGVQGSFYEHAFYSCVVDGNCHHTLGKSAIVFSASKLRALRVVIYYLLPPFQRVHLTNAIHTKLPAIVQLIHYILLGHSYRQGAY